MTPFGEANNIAQSPRFGGSTLMQSLAKVVTAGLTLLNVSVALAEESNKDLAGRIELRSFQSLTLTDQQFLTGDKNGLPVTITGELRLPQGTTGRVPVVIMLHGAGGLVASNELWSRTLNAMGVATFAIDSHGRNLDNIGANQGALGFFAYTLDAYRAQELLAAHSRIDPGRIALMGTSRGGRGALYASLRRFRDTWASGRDFVAYIPLYAACESPTVIGEEDVSNRPIRQFHGGSDDVVSIAPCRTFYERLRANGKDAQLTEFPNVWHLFDNPAVPPRPLAVKIQTLRSCNVREEKLGVLVNTVTRQPFTWDDLCVENNTHFGYDETAMRTTHAAVRDLLRTVFNLK
jgi:dienelactone hydrolase